MDARGVTGLASYNKHDWLQQRTMLWLLHSQKIFPLLWKIFYKTTYFKICWKTIFGNKLTFRKNNLGLSEFFFSFKSNVDNVCNVFITSALTMYQGSRQDFPTILSSAHEQSLWLHNLCGMPVHDRYDVQWKKKCFCDCIGMVVVTEKA